MAQLTSPTLSKLIKEARILLNQESATNSFWSDEELTIYLNDAIRVYFLEYTSNAEGGFDRVVNLPIVANEELVELPEDFFEIRAVYKNRADGYKQILVYRNNVTESYDTINGNAGDGYEPYYYFRGNNLVLRPVPNGDEAASNSTGLHIEYVGFPETMIWGGDQLTSQVSPIFKELVVMYAVYKAKVKEDLVQGTATSAKATEHLAQLYNQFRQTVGGRSKYPLHTVPYNG